MHTSDNRSHKIQALQSALEGNPQALREYKVKRGRPYTEEELEERRQYLTQLHGREASRQEVMRFFGRYEPVADTAQSYVLPNGMRLYFQ